MPVSCYELENRTLYVGDRSVPRAGGQGLHRRSFMLPNEFARTVPLGIPPSVRKILKGNAPVQ